MRPTSLRPRRRLPGPLAVAGAVAVLAVSTGTALASAPPDPSPAPTASAAPSDPISCATVPAGSDASPAADAAVADTSVADTAVADAADTSTSADPVPADSEAEPAIDVPLPANSPPDDSTVASPPPASLTPDQQIVLRRDGIGLARFCDDADTVIAAVTEVLGEPSDDSGWSDPLAVSNCGGTEVRRVTWGSLDLYFGDASQFGEGVRHFFGYVYGNRDSVEVTPQGLATPEGIGIGSTVEYVLANYPEAEVFPGEEGIAEPLFYVDENLAGFLTDHADDGVVTVIFGGEDCGV